MSFLENKNKEIEILFNLLQEHINSKFDVNIVSIDEIKVKSRKRHLVYFRRMLMVILGEAFLKNYTQDDISSVVDLDRTSFIHHSKTHYNDYGMLKSYKEEYNSLRDCYFEKIGIE